MAELDAESALVEAAIAGDASAVEQLLWVCYSPLERHIARKIPDHARRHFGAEDILQMAFSQVFRDIGRFEPRGDGSFLAWVRMIADHRLVDTLRKIDRGGATQLSPVKDADASSFRGLIDAVCQDSVTPSKRARDREAIHAIQIALAGLPADQQEVIRLHYLHHKSVEEISRETGRTEAAIRGLVYRGKRDLAAAMGRSSRWLSSS